MKKRLGAAIITTMIGVGMAMPSVLAGALMQGGFTYSKDSDGVVLHSYSIGTNDEEAPFNFTDYQTRLTQSGTTISENTLQGKWHGSVGQGYITLWAGYMKNDLRSAGTSSLMYDTNLGDNDHVWLSYGHDIVATVLAQQARIDSNSSTMSYLHKPSSDVEITGTATYTKYSDNNTQKAYNLAIKKQLNKNFALGLNFDNSNADHSASPVYYVPINESVLSLKPEVTVPLGVGKLNITAEQALAGHSNGSTSRRQSIDSAITFGKFSVGATYSSDIAYNSRTSYIKFDTSF